MTGYLTFQATSQWLKYVLGKRSLELDEVLNLSAFRLLFQFSAPVLLEEFKLDVELPTNWRRNSGLMVHNLKDYISRLSQVVKNYNDEPFPIDMSFIKVGAVADYFDDDEARDKKNEQECRTTFARPHFHILNETYSVASYLICTTFVAMSLVIKSLNAKFVRSLERLPRVQQQEIEVILLETRKKLGVHTGFLPERPGSNDPFIEISKLSTMSRQKSEIYSSVLNRTLQNVNTSIEQRNIYNSRAGDYPLAMEMSSMPVSSKSSTSLYGMSVNPNANRNGEFITHYDSRAIETVGNTMKDDIGRLIRDFKTTGKLDTNREQEEKMWETTSLKRSLVPQKAKFDSTYNNEDTIDEVGAFTNYKLNYMLSKLDTNLMEQLKISKKLFSSSTHNDIEAKKARKSMIKSNNNSILSNDKGYYITPYVLNGDIVNEPQDIKIEEHEKHAEFENSIYEDYKKSINSVIESENSQSKLILSMSNRVSTNASNATTNNNNNNINTTHSSRKENSYVTSTMQQSSVKVISELSSDHLSSFIIGTNSNEPRYRVIEESSHNQTPTVPENDEKISHIHEKIAEINTHLDNLRDIISNDHEKK